MKIFITGISGSGKTVMANRMGKILGLEVVHLDEFSKWMRKRGLEPWDYFENLMECYDDCIFEGAQICGMRKEFFEDKCVFFTHSGFFKSLIRRIMRDLNKEQRNIKNIWKYDLRLFHINRWIEYKKFRSWYEKCL